MKDLLLGASLTLHLVGVPIVLLVLKLLQANAGMAARIDELENPAPLDVERTRVRRSLAPWSAPALPSPDPVPVHQAVQEGRGASLPTVDECVAARRRMGCSSGWPEPLRGQAAGQLTVVAAVADTLEHDPALGHWPDDVVLGVPEFVDREAATGFSPPSRVGSGAPVISTARVTAGGWRDLWERWFPGHAPTSFSYGGMG